MLDGWYCRSIANQQLQSSGEPSNNDQQDDELEEASASGCIGAAGGGNGGEGGGGGVGDSGSEDESQVVTMSQSQNAINQQRIDYRAQYSGLKKKLKFLLYENEFFQDALRSSQRRLLKVTRDRSFLLDRLIQYEKTEATTSESDDTESSDDETQQNAKRRKLQETTTTVPTAIPVIPPILQSPGVTISFAPKPPPSVVQPKQRKKQLPPKKHQPASASSASYRPQSSSIITNNVVQSDGHMTAEEVERHLQSRQPLMELVPERAPPTVPNEMFSNEPSLDSESNDQLETSPIDIGGDECLSVDY